MLKLNCIYYNQDACIYVQTELTELSSIFHLTWDVEKGHCQSVDAFFEARMVVHISVYDS